MKSRVLWALAALFLLTAPSGQALAGPALDTLKVAVDEVLVILKTPVNTPGRADKLSDAVRGVFDPEELARRTLATHWKSFNQGEQVRFTDAFVKLLERTYLRRIETYTNAQVVYVSESPLGNNQAEVSTKIIAAQEVPIVYRLINKNGWKVYDVVIEGVSLVQNYRNQFNQILVSQSPAQLISRIESMSQAQ